MSLDDRLLPSEQGIYTLLGFAQKAGRLTSGNDAVRLQLAKGGVRLVLLAQDLSENSREDFLKNFERLPRRTRDVVDVWLFGRKDELGLAAGKAARGIWALSDENFAGGMISKLETLAGMMPERAVCLHKGSEPENNKKILNKKENNKKESGKAAAGKSVGRKRAEKRR